MAEIKINSPVPQTWLDYRNVEYDATLSQWIYARSHYLGTVAAAGEVTEYLVRRSVGESQGNYDERCKLADYTNHLGAVVDSIAGMLFSVEGGANRVLNDGDTKILGDFGDRSTVMGRLAVDADGMGNGYLSLWKTLAIDLLVMKKVWVLVEPNDGKTPRLRVFEPTSITNWFYDDKGLAAVLLAEVADTRSSIKDQPSTVDQYILFERDGWSRWRKDQSGAPSESGEPANGTYRFEDENGDLQLPIYPVELPIRRHIGWQLAKKANAMFNMESMRDNLLRVANSPKLNLFAGDTLFDKLIDGLAAGSNALQNDPASSKAHDYIAPSAEPAKIASEVLKRKVEEFYVSAFRMYGDSAKERQTATEIRQDVSSGVGAFLQLLKSAVDGAENQALWRLEQAVYPNDKAKWFKCRVERSDDFLPVDVDQAIDKLKERYFHNETVPVGRKAMIEAIKEMLKWDGMQHDEKEIEEAVDVIIASRKAEAIKKGGVNAPPALVAEIAGEEAGGEVRELHEAEVVKLETPPPAPTPPGGK
jgi:hypothetical protein